MHVIYCPLTQVIFDIKTKQTDIFLTTSVDVRTIQKIFGRSVMQ